MPDTVTDKGVGPTIEDSVAPAKDTTTIMTSRAVRRRITGRDAREGGGRGRLLAGLLVVLALGAVVAWSLLRSAGEEAPTQVEVSFNSSPSAAQVFEAGTELTLGTTPFTGRFDRAQGERLVEFRLPGHESLIVPVSLEEDGRCVAELDPISAPPDPPAPDLPKAADAGAVEDRGASVGLPAAQSKPGPRAPSSRKRAIKRKYQPDDLVDPFSSKGR